MTRKRWESIMRYIERIAREPKELRDAQREAECAEWYIAPDVCPVSRVPEHAAEAHTMVALLIGTMHLAWANGRKW